MKILKEIILVLLLVQGVYALEFNIESKYSPQETLIAEMSGKFIDSPVLDNFYLYSDRTYIPSIHNLMQFDGKYYYYNILPNEARNYTLIIKNVHYTELGAEKLQDLYYNFSITGNTSLFNVNPGVVFANEDFEVKVTSIVKDITITSKFLNISNEFSVKEGEEKLLEFSIDRITKSGITFLNLNSGKTSYTVPVIVYKNNSYEVPEASLSFSVPSLFVIKNQEYKFKIILENNGFKNLSDIVISESIPGLELTPLKIKKLNSFESIELNATIKSANSSNGTLIALAKNVSTSYNLVYKIIENISEFNDTNYSRKTCSQLGGNICKSGEICSGESELTLEEKEAKFCCLAECQVISSGGFGTGKTIALIILILILGGVGYYIYVKSKVKPQDPKELLENKRKEFEERFSSKETKGKLSRS